MAINGKKKDGKPSCGKMVYFHFGWANLLGYQFRVALPNVPSTDTAEANESMPKGKYKMEMRNQKEIQWPA